MTLTKDKIDFRKRIIDSMNLNGQYAELINAIYLGTRMENLILPEITPVTTNIMETLLVFYGIKDKENRIYKDMKQVLPMELKKYYRHLTLEEVSIGINKAIRGEFGALREYVGGPSLKMFREFINLYEHSDLRKKLIREFNSKMQDYVLTPVLNTEEEKQKSLEAECYCFKRYKETSDLYYVTWAGYSILLGYGYALPDFKEFLPEATVVVQRNDKRFSPKDRHGKPIQISEAVLPLLANSAERQAKKMALRKFYDKLIAAGKTLEDFLNNQQ